MPGSLWLKYISVAKGSICSIIVEPVSRSEEKPRPPLIPIFR